MAAVEAFTCPTCGAPVRASGTVGTCLYCGSVLRLQHADAGRGDAEVLQVGGSGETGDGRLRPEVRAEIVELLSSGESDAAAARYADATGVSVADAHSAVDDMFATLSIRTLQRQPLSPVGWALVSLGLAFVLVGAYAVVSGVWAGLLLVVLGALQVAVFGPAAVATLQRRSWPQAAANVVGAIDLGPMGNGSIHLMRLAVKFQDPDGTQRREVLVPVRAESTHKTQAGARVRVSYAPSDPDKTIYTGMMAEAPSQSGNDAGAGEEQ